MNRIFPTFSFLLLLAIALSGCQGRLNDPPRPTIQWGLGLQIPESLPAAGPFREGAENTTAFLHALNQTLAKVIKDCRGNQEHLATARKNIDSGLFLFAIEQAIDDCADFWNQARKLVESTRANGTEAETFARLEREAMETIARQANRLSQLPPPGSVADAEVQGRLMSSNVYSADIIDTAQDAFAAYNRTGDKGDLEVAYLNTLLSINAEDATLFFIYHYPWSNGTCTRPDVSELAKWLDSEISWIINASLVLEPPHPSIPINQIYGEMVKGIQPYFRYYESRGWWPAMLGLVGIVTFDRAVLETHKENRLPTREEANYLFALHQSMNRTWSGELLMTSLNGRINDGGPWEEVHEPEARQALALEKIRPGFLGLHCTGTPGK
ncbi:MAG: hypothetical protein LC623_00225 [Halobacteriales archaeon]|nr:hypothetical protein [Halobacteriales archaeon]